MPLCAPRPCTVSDSQWKALQQTKFLRLQRHKSNVNTFRIVMRRQKWAVAHATTESAIRNDWKELVVFVSGKEKLSDKELREALTTRSTSLTTRHTAVKARAKAAAVARSTLPPNEQNEAPLRLASSCGNLESLMRPEYDGTQLRDEHAPEVPAQRPERATIGSPQEAVYDPQLAFTFAREGRSAELRQIVSALGSAAVVSMRDDQQQTCLHIATLAGDLGLVSFLVNAGMHHLCLAPLTYSWLRCMA